MITSLVLQGVGIGILTSLDVVTEVRAGLLSFTRISDPVLRPMTLALCTAAARPPSYAADIVLGEIQSAFGLLASPGTGAPRNSG
jgi:DNA-binding transcriptional LysR family regulator